MLLVDAKAKSASIEAVITRADGTIVNLGTVDYWHRSIIKRIIWRIKKWLHF
jgi:hypothetical protein